MRFFPEINTKAAWLQKLGCFVVDCEIARKSIGCSLTIHRVEISVVSGKSVMAHRAANDNFFDCVNQTSISSQIESMKTA